jgi:hypothetical protein
LLLSHFSCAEPPDFSKDFLVHREQSEFNTSVDRAAVFDSLRVELVPLVCGGATLAAANPVDTGGAGGKRLVLLVGQKKAVAIALRNLSGRARWSDLGEWPRPGPGGQFSLMYEMEFIRPNGPQSTKMLFSVYVLGSQRKNDRRTYVGWTTDLERRLLQHNAGVGAKSTRGGHQA